MLNSKFNWEIVSQEKNVALDEGQLLPTVLDLIQKRGFSDREVFEEGEFHDPFLFSDMQKSVDRIKQAVESEQLILIYGDYDIDGVSATAILVSAIRQLGGNVHYYIPNRFYEGYGPNEEAFLQAIDDGFELIITVDNGVSGIEEAKLLAEHHVDYIVTDHHHLKSELPQALGLLHPEHDATYPFDELCGAGVALKLAQALLGDDVPDEFVMYAMLGTIGDVVPLRHENRTIVKKGLKTLRQTKHFGLNALAKCLDLTLDQATEVTIGFDIGPVINAAGRMDEARYAVDLLLADSIDRAHDIANQLVALNTLRQQETQSVLEMAKEQIEKENKSNQNVLILFNQNWHEGVLGIVAGRLTRDLQKAVFVLTEDEFGLAKGSARSVEGIHLFDCLSECEELITKFGGHALAAGISLEVENLTLLEAKLNEKLSGECIQSKLVIDQCLNLDEASIVMYEQLQVLAPFGEGNRAPVFMFKDVHIKQISCIGNQKQHLKCTLVKEGETLNVISFNQAHLAIYLNEEDCFDVVGELKINEWNGKKTLQLHMQDIRCESFQVLDLRNTKAYQENVNRLPKGVKLSSFNEANPLRCEHFIIDQMPASFDELFKCMNETKPMTVTLYPLQSDLVLPIREKFAFAYQILKKHQSLALNEQTYKAFLARGINKNEVNFIFQVFFEIELAIIKNGAVFYVQTSEKHDLTKAPSYEAMNSKQQMVEFFELSSGSEIKTTFLNAREESHYES